MMAHIMCLYPVSVQLLNEAKLLLKEENKIRNIQNKPNYGNTEMKII